MTRGNIIGILAFLALMVVVIYYLWQVIQDYRDTRGNEPWLVKDTKMGRSSKIIPSAMIPFSNDGQYGIEFTYMFWIYISNWEYQSGKYKHIFHKGNHGGKPLQAPGVWLYPDQNRMLFVMNTFSAVDEQCSIGNLPIGKWFHVAVVLINRNLDVYINGKLKRRCLLRGLPRQNYGDLYINSLGGFDGFLSRFRYYNYAVPYYKIERAFEEGPSDAPCEGVGLAVPPYLSSRWWFQNKFPESTYPTT